MVLMYDENHSHLYEVFAVKSQSLERPVSAAEPPVSRATSALAQQSTVDSRVLFAGGSELVIFHYGETYQLRQTRLGKLILTK
jgi:hemin uptake protein HemP